VHRLKMKFALASLLGFLLQMGIAVCQPVGEAQISGFVHDARGAPRPGAFVNVLATNSTVKGSTYTDLDGHYVIGRLAPGRYSVWSTATLLAPTVQRVLSLRPGTRAIVNLSIPSISEVGVLLSAKPRSLEEPGDEWRWALRSSANRPILRILSDSEGGLPSVEGNRSANLERIISVYAGGGGFGRSGSGVSLDEVRARRNSLLKINLGVNHFPQSGPTSSIGTRISVQAVRSLGFASEQRSLISFESHPEIVDSSGVKGLSSLRLVNAQRSRFGDVASLEFGSSIDIIHAGGLFLGAHPFLRFEAHPTTEWYFGYKVATSKNAQGYDDLSEAEKDLPVATSSGSGMHMADELHQELFVEKNSRDLLLRLIYYRDSSGTTTLTGIYPSIDQVSSASLAGLMDVGGREGVLRDVSSSTFRRLAHMTGSQGWSVGAKDALTPTLWLVLSYSRGQALALNASSSTSFGRVEQTTSQAVAVGIVGRAAGIDTKLRVTYRWQPFSTATSVDPYDSLDDESYFSIHMRQPLKCRALFLSGFEATVDATNLFAQGYHPAGVVGGETVFLTNGPRAISAGLAHSF